MLLTKIQLETAYGDSYGTICNSRTARTRKKTNAEVLDEAAKKTFERLYLNLLKVTEMGLPANEVQLEFYKAEYGISVPFSPRTRTLTSFCARPGCPRRNCRRYT